MTIFINRLFNLFCHFLLIIVLVYIIRLMYNRYILGGRIMELTISIVLLIFSYLLGSIPTGLLLGKMKGIDIREHGSKNIGATNTGRVLGMRYAVIAYIFDMLKGAILVFLFRFGFIDMEYCLVHPLLYGVAATLGHTSSIYLKFKGGKAVATSSGVIFGYCPWLLIPGLIVFFLTTYLTRYVSVGSIVGSTFTMLLIIVLAIIKQDPFFDYEYDIFFPIFTAIIYVIVIIRHKANITRLKQKTESQVKWARKKS